MEEIPTSGPDESWAVPYAAGQHIQLQVTESESHFGSQTEIKVVVEELISITMSPVMRVTLVQPVGDVQTAILKLYDRRFGIDLRQGERGVHLPLTQSREDAFLSFVREQKMESFLKEADEEDDDQMIPARAWHFLDEEPDGMGKFEAMMWRDVDEYFECEHETYRRLADVQGELIPRMYGKVRVVTPVDDDAQALPPGTESYFTLNGILFEFIPGYLLRDLAISPLAPHHEDAVACSAIVQAAMDAAHAVNQRGIIMDDCDPRNIVIQEGTHKPFIIDLAQCEFKDKLIQTWLDLGWADTDSSDDDEPGRVENEAGENNEEGEDSEAGTSTYFGSLFDEPGRNQDEIKEFRADDRTYFGNLFDEAGGGDKRAGWLKYVEDEADEPWDPEEEWLLNVRQADNTGRIACLMIMRMRKVGVELRIYEPATGRRVRPGSVEGRDSKGRSLSRRK